ncbi:MAG: hypothetical protein IPM96_01875 [Ignavibacteria bacterium]|nr:hypothetical protein [Ignavibacteria bacterium]
MNQDGTVDVTDNVLIDNDAGNFMSGYIPTDVNGDETTDVSDAAIADNNAVNFCECCKAVNKEVDLIKFYSHLKTLTAMA